MQIQWQSKRFVRATGHEAKGFTVRNTRNVFNPIENYCKSNDIHQVRFGTCLSFMKCFDHFWTNDFSTKEGFKNFTLDLIFCLKSESTYHFQKIRKHVSLSGFPTILFYEFSGPSKKGFRNSKREPIKSDQDFNRLIWHERTNCLNLKLHRKDFCKISHAEFCLTNHHWRVKVRKFNKSWKIWFENLFGDGSRSTLK